MGRRCWVWPQGLKSGHVRYRNSMRGTDMRVSRSHWLGLLWRKRALITWPGTRDGCMQYQWEWLLHRGRHRRVLCGPKQCVACFELEKYQLCTSPRKPFSRSAWLDLTNAKMELSVGKTCARSRNLIRTWETNMNCYEKEELDVSDLVTMNIVTSLFMTASHIQSLFWNFRAS